MSADWQSERMEAASRTLAVMAALDEPEVAEAQEQAQAALDRLGSQLTAHGVGAEQVLMQLITVGAGVWLEAVSR